MKRTLVAVVIVMAACGLGEPIEHADYVVRDSSGIRIVESFSPILGGDARFSDLELVTQIGDVSGSTAYLFGLIGDAKLLPNGWIAVAESQANELRFFRSDGEYLATFGGSGDGPNEFRGIGPVFRYPGDSVAVFDFGLSRTLILPVPPNDARSVSGLIEDVRAPLRGILSDGSIVSTQGVAANRDTPATPAWDSSAVVVAEPDGGSSREILRLAAALSSYGPAEDRIILSPASILAAGRERIYWARNDRYEILAFDRSGTLVSILRRPIEPLRLTESDRETYSDSTVARLRLDGRAEAAQRYEQLFRVAPFADTRPLFWRAFVDVDGRLWLSEWPWPARFTAPRRWSVFSAEGFWLRDVVVPDGFLVHDAAGDTVLGQWSDAVGVPYLRLYRFDD